MKVLKTIIILTMIALLMSCGRTNRQIEKEKKIAEMQKTQLLMKNIQESNHLCKKYNAINMWDTLANYTYILQDIFLDKNQLICFEGDILDIIKSDSIFILKVRRTYWKHEDLYFLDDFYFSGDFVFYRSYLANISVNPSKFSEIWKILNSGNHSREGCFIFEVSKIITLSPTLKSDVEIMGLEGQDSYSYIWVRLNLWGEVYLCC